MRASVRRALVGRPMEGRCDETRRLFATNPDERGEGDEQSEQEREKREPKSALWRGENAVASCWT